MARYTAFLLTRRSKSARVAWRNSASVIISKPVHASTLAAWRAPFSPILIPWHAVAAQVCTETPMGIVGIPQPMVGVFQLTSPTSVEKPIEVFSVTKRNRFYSHACLLYAVVPLYLSCEILFCIGEGGCTDLFDVGLHAFSKWGVR